jgi:hypothetical protein
MVYSEFPLEAGGGVGQSDAPRKTCSERFAERSRKMSMVSPTSLPDFILVSPTSSIVTGNTLFFASTLVVRCYEHFFLDSSPRRWIIHVPLISGELSYLVIQKAFLGRVCAAPDGGIWSLLGRRCPGC